MGYEADYMVWTFEHQWLARECDIDLGIYNIGMRDAVTRQIEFLHYASQYYDIFHFHSAHGLLQPSSLWSCLSELSFLKKAGKKIVMSWWGCDINREPVDSQYQYSPCAECSPRLRRTCMDEAKLAAIEKAYNYADAHLSNGNLLHDYERMQWMDNAIDCDEWRPLNYEEIPDHYKLPKNEKIKIYHSFGNSGVRGDVKGTEHIKAAVAKLQNEGYMVEFLFFDKVPNRHLKYYQAQADIVVDQLRTGWHGSTAMECMAIGKPVITYIRPCVKQHIPHEAPPLIEATIDSIYDVLKSLLDNKQSLETIGERAREFAVKYHHYTRVAKQLSKVYQRLYEV
jgi:hypothetical protein